MLGSERQLKILSYLKITKTASIRTLMNELYVSEATVRRDLNELERAGSIKRIFGGAKLVDNAEQIRPIFSRRIENIQEKTVLCKRAAKLVHNGDVIFLDGSTTVNCIIPFLAEYHDITIITNGLGVLQTLSGLHINVYITGGTLNEYNDVLFGNQTLKFIDDFSANIAFISVSGLNEKGVFTNSSLAGAEVRKKYIEHTDRTAIIMTAEKYPKTFIHNVATTRDVDYLFMTGGLPDGITVKNDMTDL